ncbi:MAG: hypothetical protein QOE59_5075 [Actinomycetota bacterium]|jgi:hypothetical protein|nr:hypothetical protein [Actinomycetota bacterium]
MDVMTLGLIAMRSLHGDARLDLVRQPAPGGVSGGRGADPGGAAAEREAPSTATGSSSTISGCTVAISPTDSAKTWAPRPPTPARSPPHHPGRRARFPIRRHGDNLLSSNETALLRGLWGLYGAHSMRHGQRAQEHPSGFSAW